MFAAAFVSLFALTASVVAMPSGHVRHAHRSVPTQFQTRNYTSDADLLEPYAAYHERYELFNCPEKHNTTFFDQCCHPLMKDVSEDTLPDVCFEDVPCDPETTTTSHVSTVVPTTSVEKIASTTSSHKPETTTTHPTTTAHPTTTHKTSSAHPTTSVSSSGGSFESGGFGTYFYQEGNAGACGVKHSDDDLIVAIDIARYGDDSKKSSLCGKKVQIINTDNGHTVTATVEDVCPTCDNSNSIDLSVATFKALDELSVGEIPIKWRFVS